MSCLGESTGGRCSEQQWLTRVQTRTGMQNGACLDQRQCFRHTADLLVTDLANCLKLSKNEMYIQLYSCSVFELLVRRNPLRDGWFVDETGCNRVRMIGS
jgi:hypothetical protein